jgi:mono/diheme cytochrome c family protein
MQRLLILVVIVAAAAMGAPQGAVADSGIDPGRREYDAGCALCHGADGRGDGSFGELLQLTIPDLTTLARRNGGVFPTDRVYAVIDGREEVKAHGAREMPIWGKYFSAVSTPEYDDYRNVPEAFVRSRILALIDFLNRRQVK